MSLGSVAVPDHSETLPPPHRIRRTILRILVLLALLALAWYVGRLAGRPQLFLAGLIGLVPIVVISVARLIATGTRRPTKTLVGLLVGLLVALGSACAFYLFSSQDPHRGAAPARAPLPVTILLPITVSASYNGKGMIGETEVTLDEELVVSGSTMNQIRDDLLRRLVVTTDPTEIDAALTWCLDGGTTIPASWTIPAGFNAENPSVTDVRQLLAQNWAECFRPDRLSSPAWRLDQRLDDGFVYHRSRTVNIEAASPVYSLATVALNLGRFDAGLVLNRTVVYYSLASAAGSSLQLTAPKGAIADIDPSGEITSLPGRGEKVTLDIARQNTAVDVAVLAGPFRNPAGLAIYKALLWGALQWVVGIVAFLASSAASEFGLSLVKGSFRRLGRIFPKGRGRTAAV